MCVSAQEVERLTADFLLAVERKQLAWPSEMPYFHVSLTEVETGKVVDQFVSWDGARPYTSNESLRRYDMRGPLAQLLIVPE